MLLDEISGEPQYTNIFQTHTDLAPQLTLSKLSATPGEKEVQLSDII